MIYYENFSEFAKQHKLLADVFLREYGHLDIKDGEIDYVLNLPRDWQKLGVYYYSSVEEYVEYYRNECSCINSIVSYTGPSVGEFWGEEIHEHIEIG